MYIFLLGMKLTLSTRLVFKELEFCMNLASSYFVSASLLIFLALMVTLSVVALDERMALYPLQPSLW